MMITEEQTDKTCYVIGILFPHGTQLVINYVVLLACGNSCGIIIHMNNINWMMQICGLLCL